MQDFLLTKITSFGTETNVSCLLAAVSGLLSHWLYFIRGHRSMEIVGIINFHVVAQGLLLFRTISSQGVYRGLVSYAVIFGSYLVALFASIGIYRLFFHPLRRFPGPFPSKITKLYIPWMNRDWKLHDRYVEMHSKYGEFLRIGKKPSTICRNFIKADLRLGPNDISVVNLDAFNKIHGPQSKCTKRNTGFYDGIAFKGELNLDSLWHNDTHRDRRKIWDQALGSKALETYEESTRSVLRTFLAHLDEKNGEPINTTLYAKLIPFDNMGRVAFSRDFGTVRDGRDDRMLEMIETSFKIASRFGQMPWPMVFIASLPHVGKLREFDDLGVRLVDERIATDSDEKQDMMTYFLRDLNSEKPRSFFKLDTVYADTQAVLIGGTDTISCLLGYSFYYLARDSQLRQRLYDEMAPTHGKTIPGEFAVCDLNKLEYLEAFINETLRMNTPASINGPRISPPEGVVVDGTYIPGNVTLVTPLHIFHRSPKYWKQPDEFIPERWTTRPELIINRKAFVPFHYGRFDCVGRRLALNAVRLTIAYTLWNHDFCFAPGEDGTRVERDAQFQLIVKPGRLDCVFTKRPGAGA